MTKPAAKKTATKRLSITKRPAAAIPADIPARSPFATVVVPATQQGKRANTPDERRLAKNAALREWRKAHADEQRAYMREWRERQKAKEKPHQSTPTVAVKTSALVPAAEKAKKGGAA